MQITIVGERLNLTMSAELRSSMRLSSAAADDAVQVSLNTEAKASAAAAQTQSGGYLGQLFKHIENLAEQIRSRSDQLNNALLTSEQRSAVQKELAALQAEFQSIQTSRDFMAVREQTGSFAANLGGANDGSGLAGSAYLNLLKGGYVSRLADVKAALDEIAQITPEALADGSVAARLAAVAARGRTALDAPLTAAAETAAVPVPTAPESFAPPQLTTIQYVNGTDVALSLKGYQGRDLIKAAVLGAVDDPRLASYLVIEPPTRPTLEEQRRKEEEEQRRLPIAAPDGLSILA